MDGKKYVGIFLNILIPVVTLYLVCVWGPRLLAFFLPFVIGWVIAMIANPLVRLLERKLKIVRRHSSVILIIGVLALVITGVYLLTAWGIREMSGFLEALPGLFDMMQEEVNQAAQTLGDLVSFVPPETEETLLNILSSMSTAIGEFLQNMAASAGGAVARTIPDVFVSTIVVILSSYLLLAEHDQILSAVRKILPESAKRYFSLMKKDIRKVIGGYFMAQFKIMFVVAVLLLIGFLILGVHYSVLLAMAIAFLDFLPMFGTGTALIPWALVKLFAGEYMYAFGLAVLYVTTQAVRQIIQPKIVGDSLGLPPLTTLFLLFIGYRIRGLAGMILAVPIGIIFMKFYEYGVFDSFFENIKILWKEIQRIRGKE